jgi:hypothetical protein
MSGGGEGSRWMEAAHEGWATARPCPGAGTGRSRGVSLVVWYLKDFADVVRCDCCHGFSEQRTFNFLNVKCFYRLRWWNMICLSL